MDATGRQVARRLQRAGFTGWMVLSGGALLALACEASPPAQTGSVPTRLLKLAPQQEAESPGGTAPERTKPDVPTRLAPRASSAPPTDVAPKPSSVTRPDAGAVAGDASTPTPQWARAAELTIRRGVLTRRVVEREPAPVSALRLGQPDEPIIAFFELTNASSRPARLVVTFIHERGEEVGFVELHVPERRERWRTWAETRRVRRPGQWQVVVRTLEGEEVGRVDFVVAQRLEEGAPPTPVLEDKTENGP